MTATARASLDDILPAQMLRLGFGCGGLLHGMSRNQSLHLLETAIDCGVTYFDTARMYGFGDAEGVLGTLVPRHRGNIVIASKAGILPQSRSIPLRVLNRGIKLLHKAAPPLKNLVPAPAALHPRFSVFEPQTLRKSLETSLRELKTDYLDIFLLHECTEVDTENEDLLHLLQSFQKEGKIRKFGIATGIEETIKVVEASPLLSDVVQIASSIWNTNIKRLPHRPSGITITHSTLTSRFHELTNRLSSDDTLAKRWKAAIQIDPRDKGALARLLLAYALHLNPDGAVLFFSNNPKNIRASVGVATEAPISSEQIDGLNALAKDKDETLPLEGLYRDHLSVS